VEKWVKKGCDPKLGFVSAIILPVVVCAAHILNIKYAWIFPCRVNDAMTVCSSGREVNGLFLKEILSCAQGLLSIRTVG